MSTDDGVFDGEAELEVAGQRCPVRVRLVEKIPSGQLMVSGVGLPPYGLVTGR
ncbi:hypothetical protein ACXDF8_20085 [Mycolicibacterium sp. CBM1]